jgi:hypothetical protein
MIIDIYEAFTYFDTLHRMKKKKKIAKKTKIVWRRAKKFTKYHLNSFKDGAFISF